MKRITVSAILAFFLVSIIVLVVADSTRWLVNNHSIAGQDADNHICFAQELYYAMSDIVRGPLALHEKISALIGLLKFSIPQSAPKTLILRISLPPRYALSSARGFLSSR
jgi:hypothetical protein